MTIDPSSNVRIEEKIYQSSLRRYKIYIFKCIRCESEIRVQEGAISRSTGLCRRCAKNGTPFLGVYNALKSKAAKRKIQFDLSFEDFISFTRNKFCTYCNRDIAWSPHNNTRTNLDRKNNSEGYILSNLTVCCKKCNELKSNFWGHEEFKRIMSLHVTGNLR